MITVLAWILCALGWSIALMLIRRNDRLRRELALALLRVAKEPMLGRDLVKMSGGALRPGMIYVTLTDLEDDGLVLSDPCLDDPHGRRRIYTASNSGAQLHRDRLGPLAELKPPPEWKPNARWIAVARRKSEVALRIRRPFNARKVLAVEDRPRRLRESDQGR